MRQTNCQCVSTNLNYGLLLSVTGWYIIGTPSQCFNAHAGLHWVLPSSTNTTRLSVYSNFWSPAFWHSAQRQSEIYYPFITISHHHRNTMFTYKRKKEPIESKLFLNLFLKEKKTLVCYLCIESPLLPHYWRYRLMCDGCVKLTAYIYRHLLYWTSSTRHHYLDREWYFEK